jgi:hypothetical protein
MKGVAGKEMVAAAILSRVGDVTVLKRSRRLGALQDEPATGASSLRDTLADLLELLRIVLDGDDLKHPATVRESRSTDAVLNYAVRLSKILLEEPAGADRDPRCLIGESARSSRKAPSPSAVAGLSVVERASRVGTWWQDRHPLPHVSPQQQRPQSQSVGLSRHTSSGCTW